MAITNWANLVSGTSLQTEMRKRKNPYIEKKDHVYEVVRQELESEGWEFVQEYADGKTAKYRKLKTFYDAFEDKVWCMLAQMGFTQMNQGKNQFVMAYGSDGSHQTQQIDVFAADEETVLVIECKSSEELTKKTFKKEIEAFQGQISGLIKEIKKQFPTQKIKFIWATENIIISDSDADRLTNANIAVWDENVIKYYQDLCKHLGSSAKYQLLGSLFENQSIEGLKIEIPAVRGKMGGHIYYSFSIEPATLLKIGYVLHRMKGNLAEMPTYQRIIKKNRLDQIRSFVENNGYFPNSIIVSIDSGKKDIRFDPLGKGSDDTIARAGILHLPPRYHSAFIIDGQHRLYGYSDTKYAETNTIPVVAFENLSRPEQLKLFMEINENQRAVPKRLRSTLEKDTLWLSNNLADRRRAMRSHIGQILGEHKDGPLYGRVIVGEDDETNICTISINSLSDAMGKSHFFNTYAKGNVLISAGLFDYGESDDHMEATCSKIVKILEGCFAYLADKCSEDWNSGLQGILPINRGAYGVIKLVDDLIVFLCSRGEIDAKKDEPSKICNTVIYYLDGLVEYINTILPTEKQNLKNTFGTNGFVKFWRYFEKAVSDRFDEFVPEGLKEYIEDQTQKYNNTSRGYIEEIEKEMRIFVKNALSDAYGPKDMVKEGVPKDLYKSACSISAARNAEIDTSDEEAEHVSAWDCLTLEDLQEIVLYRTNWSGVFSDIMLIPGYDKGNQNNRTEWLKELNEMKNKLNASNTNYSIKKEKFDLIETIYKWFKERKEV